MSPKAVKISFVVLGIFTIIFLAFGVVYVISLYIWGSSQMPAIDGNAWACAKVGLNCNKVDLQLHPPTKIGHFFGTLADLPWFKNIAVSSLFMMCGIFAYWFRCRAQVLYGFVEIMVSLAFGATGLYSINVQNFRILGAATALLGAIYIVVRGMDNIEKGLTIVPEWQSEWKRRWSGA